MHFPALSFACLVLKGWATASRTATYEENVDQTETETLLQIKVGKKNLGPQEALKGSSQHQSTWPEAIWSLAAAREDK